MAANVHSVKCPQLVCAGCGGEAVEASYLSTTVELRPCSSLLAQGWTGHQLTLWHSQALELLVPAEAAQPMVHAEGLVVFA
jgi:hypothetical protein